MTDRKPESLLPLKPDVFSVLLVLMEGPAHGYAIMQAARDRSLSGGQLQPGAMYRVLKRMLEDGLLEEVPESEVPDDSDERRRTYRVTGFGRATAAAEARRMESLVSVSRAHALLDGAKRA